ncbi:MAG: DUF1080 domain-containing protein [Bacteroidota bacterium]
MKNKLNIFLFIAALILVNSEIQAKRKPLRTTQKSEWISLFDGKTLTGWHLFNHIAEPKNWAVEDGAIVCLGYKGPSGAGDLVSDRSFENFELTWEWKVDKGSNSGVFYHVVEGPKYHRPSATAPEYQVIDEINFPTKLEGWQKTGADYAMYPPDENRVSKPIGEWNTSSIIFNKGRAEYWLNGKRVVKFTAWTADWNARKASEKWKDYPDYGLAKTGLIGLQDHNNSKTYFKNIRIREL